MAFQKRYYYTFRSIKNNPYTVELWQNTSNILTAEEVVADAQPLVITYPDADNKFTPVRGSSCDIKLVSTSNMKFIDLYTSNMQEYKVYVKSGSTVLWTGYLDSELYEEPFADLDNYSVSLTANDGLALLDRIEFYHPSGPYRFSGMLNNWNIVTTILQKLNITWNNIYVGLTTTSPSVTINTTKNILTETYSISDNYYDEDGKPMTCREVLETILTAFTSYIQIINGNVFITDVNNLASSTHYFYKYDASFNYVGYVQLTTELGDISTIGSASNEMTYSIVSPVNKQKITFSPYIDTKLLEYDATKDNFTTLDVSGLNGLYPYQYREYDYMNSNYFFNLSGVIDIKSRFSKLEGVAYNDGTKYSYLKVCNWIGTNDTTLRFVYIPTSGITGKLPYVIPSAHLNYYLKIEASGYPQITENMGDPNVDNELRRVVLNTKIKIGNYYYNGSSWGGDSFFTWEFSNSTRNTETLLYEYQKIAEKWTDLKAPRSYLAEAPKPLYVPLFGFDGTEVSFEIYGFNGYDNNNVNITQQIQNFRIKSIKFTVVDSNYNEIENKDKEFTYYLNKLVRDDGDDVEFKLGTNIDTCPTAKGSILANNGSYYHLQDFTRAGVTDTLENLYGRSLVSNYTNKTRQLTCSINRIDSIFGTLTYTNYLPNTKLGIQGAKIDYDQESIELTLQEISGDNLDIIKNY